MICSDPLFRVVININNFIKILLIILTILLVSSALPAMENLVNILKIAEESDPIYKEAKISALAIAEKVPQARAQIFFPRIAIRASSNRVRDDISTTSFGANGISKYNSRNYDYKSWSLHQAVDFGLYLLK